MQSPADNTNNNDERTNTNNQIRSDVKNHETEPRPQSSDVTSKNEDTSQSDVDNQLQQKKQPLNPCWKCKTEEMALVCIPCAHLVSCVSCAKHLRLCPRCNKEITCFLRVYL